MAGARRGLDHWITEYRNADERRWVRVDTEHLGHGYVERPEDLAPGEFLTGGEAWIQYRKGLIDPLHRVSPRRPGNVGTSSTAASSMSAPRDTTVSTWSRVPYMSRCCT